MDIAVKPGENVIYGKYDGTELKYNEINHQMIKDDDILLKYSGKEPTVENVECIKDQVMVKLPPKEESNAAGKHTKDSLAAHSVTLISHVGRHHHCHGGEQGEESHVRSGDQSGSGTTGGQRQPHAHPSEAWGRSEIPRVRGQRGQVGRRGVFGTQGVRYPRQVVMLILVVSRE